MKEGDNTTVNQPVDSNKQSSDSKAAKTKKTRKSRSSKPDNRIMIFSKED